MDSNKELVNLSQYLAQINDTLTKFAEHSNEKLSNLTDEINRCQSNLIILEKKIEASLDK